MKGLEHLNDEWIAVLRWLAEGRVEHVLIGPAAAAIRGQAGAAGPVEIVPAPYGRNLDRLAGALHGTGVRLRTDGAAETAPVRLSGAKLAAGERWTVRCDGVHDLDIEIVAAERYAELLYEAHRFEIEPGLNVEVGSTDDLSQGPRPPESPGEPEIRISRGPVLPQNAA